MKKLRAMDLRSAWVIAVASVAVSMVIAAMAGLTTALPEIALVTGANTGQMTWIMDGYTLALAALLLPAGALGDRLGRREVLIVGLIIFGGRNATTHQSVETAAADAARAASIERSATVAKNKAIAAATTSLSNQGIGCLDIDVSVDTSQFSRTVGETAAVTVTVECRLDLSDLSVPGVPGSRLIKATMSSPIDTWRERG